VLPRHGPTLVPVRSERTEKSFGECQWPVIALSGLIASASSGAGGRDEFGRDRESDL
jgi:hypothetical protein